MFLILTCTTVLTASRLCCFCHAAVEARRDDATEAAGRDKEGTRTDARTRAEAKRREDTIDAIFGDRERDKAARNTIQTLTTVI